MMLLFGRAGPLMPMAAIAPPRLTVHLSQTPRLNTALPPPAAIQQSRSRRSATPGESRNKPVEAVPGRVSPFATPANSVITPATTNLDARTMIEHGRSMIEQESRQRMLDPMFVQPSPKSTPLSPLARALTAPVVGERRLTDNIHQYTLVDGRRLCFTTPPALDITNRDGPAPRDFAVATNCPR